MKAALACLAAAACAHGTPVVTSSDPDLCFTDGTAAATIVAPHGSKVGVCIGDESCLVIDHVRGIVERRTGIEHAELGLPPELEPTPREERWEIKRTETETSICDREGLCRTLRLPGVADQQTVMPAISDSGAELYYVVREGEKAFLDTIGIDARARRLGRVPLLPVGNAQESFFSEQRVGSAVLVTDSIPLGLNNERRQQILVDPLTGAVRALMTGTARELDAETAIVLEPHRASIVKTRSLKKLSSQDIGEGAQVGADGGLAVVAFTNPPTIVVVENRRFTRTWRLPVCRR